MNNSQRWNKHNSAVAIKKLSVSMRTQQDKKMQICTDAGWVCGHVISICFLDPRILGSCALGDVAFAFPKLISGPGIYILRTQGP